jgi:hypothetical protein
MATEKVRPYYWKSGKLKGKKNPGFVRTAKPKKHTGIHRAESVNVKLIRFRDDEGRVVKQKTLPISVKSDI